jgi:hypothetical protein
VQKGVVELISLVFPTLLLLLIFGKHLLVDQLPQNLYVSNTETNKVRRRNQYDARTTLTHREHEALQTVGDDLGLKAPAEETDHAVLCEHPSEGLGVADAFRVGLLVHLIYSCCVSLL